MKRIMDILFSFSGLVLLSPVFLILYFLIRFKMGSPAIFKQVRPGKNGKPFAMYKFRSMTGETNEKGDLLPDSERITRFGMLLRKSSLDELPELWNVLRGDMSLVGPRPLLMEYLTLYSREQAKRHDVRPGITGWAQVNGRNAISWEKKFELDVWYVKNQSILLDIKIIFLTLAKVLKRDGISAENAATVSKFEGNRCQD